MTALYSQRAKTKFCFFFLLNLMEKPKINWVSCYAVGTQSNKNTNTAKLKNQEQKKNQQGQVLTMVKKYDCSKLKAKERGKAVTMRAFQGKVGRSWLNKWVRPIVSTTHLSLSSSIRVLSKSNTITILGPAIFTDFPAFKVGSREPLSLSQICQ